MLNRLVQPGGSAAEITNKNSLARIYGISEAEVGYLESGNSINQSKILFHPDTETTWDKGNASGIFNSISLNPDGSANLVTSTGSFNINLALNQTSVLSSINKFPPKVSDYAAPNTDITSVLSVLCSKAAKINNTVEIDINVIVDSFVIPENITLIVLPGVTVSKKVNSTGHMFIASNYSVLKSVNKKGKIAGDLTSSSKHFAFSAVGVTGAGLEDIEVVNFVANGAYFENTTRTFCRKNYIHQIKGGAVETSCGQYVTNCIEHVSSENIIENVDSNGIKFRADSLGRTVGCKSISDTVNTAGFIGIANGKCQDHLVSNPYVKNCVDNGVDFNGCYNAKLDGGTADNCQDGAYLGENNIVKCSITNFTSKNCKRSGIGSLGSLTYCEFSNVVIDNCGSGIYCSGFVGLKIINCFIIGSFKADYLDNETGTTKTSTGRGIDIQTNLSSCYQIDILNNTFLNNSGYDISIGPSGTIADSMIKNNHFSDSAGDGKINYGGATKTNLLISGNIGYVTEITKTYSITGDGTTTIFSLNLPSTVLNTNYRIVSILPDYQTTVRPLLAGKSVTSFNIEFGTAPTATTRSIEVRLEELTPV